MKNNFTQPIALYNYIFILVEIIGISEILK